jgi:SAM-dependent methyltransferase
LAIRNTLVNAVAYVRTHGVRGYLQSAWATIVERWYERRLGIDTNRFDTMEELGIHDPDAVDHAPIPYVALRSALARVPRSSESCFLDYGAGRGRAVAFAATRPFRRVIGVELVRTLADVARANLAKARGLRCRDVSILTQNATSFEVPDDVDVIHFFKPFHGKTLEDVLDRVEASYRRRPRRLTVIFFNDQEFRPLVDGRDWLRRCDGGVFLPRTRWPIEWGMYCAPASPTSTPYGRP